MGIRYAINETFFDKWSSQMAYILGYLFADGSMEDASYLRGRYIRVTSVERRVIQNIKNLLGSAHSIVPRKSYWPNGKTVYLLRIGSHRLYDSLTRLGLFPNKSLVMTLPRVPERFLNDFVRGYFDGDGCVYLQMSNGKTRQKIIKKLSVIFTSGSKIFLEQLAKELKNRLDLSQNVIYLSHRSFELRYSTSDSIKLFKFLYHNVRPNLFFKRKLNIFLKYFLLREIKVDKYVRKIQNTILKHGHVVK